MATTVTPEAVEKVVFDALASSAPSRAEITRDATFEELDVDSLDLAELGADRRGRVRRPAQGRRRRQDQDRRRRRRPDGEPRGMKREVVITGVGAVTPLGVGARTLHERWCAGASGIEDGEGAATRVRADRPPVREGGPPRRPLHPARASSPATRRWREAGLGRRAALRRPSASAASSAPASAASARSSTATRCCSSRAPSKVLAARRSR